MSDNTLMTNHLTDMVTSGDYNFVLSPVAPEFLQTAVPICDNYEYVLLGAEGCCKAIEDTLASYPYFFSLLNHSTRNQMEELFKILRDWQGRSVNPAPTPMDVYIIYSTNLHGIEYRDAFEAEAAKYGGNFTIVTKMSVDPLATNVTAQLEEAYEWPLTHGGVDVELLCSFTYPHTSLAAIKQAAEGGYNFDAMLVGPGCNFEYTLLPQGHLLGTGVGAGNMTGVMGFGAWNEYSPAAAGGVAALVAALSNLNVNGVERFAVDWWGALPYYAGLQCLQQAIERAGSLNNTAVRAELAAAWPGSLTNPPFDTVLGPAWFTDAAGNPVGPNSGGLLAKECYAGRSVSGST